MAERHKIATTLSLIFAVILIGCEPGELVGQEDPEGFDRFVASVKYKLGDRGKPADYDQTTLRQSFAASTLPLSFNWMKKGVVTEAKDQRSCGSCWAFATVGAIESKIMIANGARYDLSEQQQVSCNRAMLGCNGGWMTALRFYDNTGPMLESCTGYSASNGNCSSLGACSRLGVRTTGYYTVYPSISAIKQSLYNDGPSYFRYTVYSDFYSFWYYGQPGEVYQNKSGYLAGGHAVLIVGWDNNKRAWLCKNSWGRTSGPNNDGTFWISWDGHLHNLGFGMANVGLVGNPPKPTCKLTCGKYGCTCPSGCSKVCDKHGCRCQ